MLSKNHYIPLIYIVIIASLLTACDEEKKETKPSSLKQQPHALNAQSMSRVNVLARSRLSSPQITLKGDTITFSQVGTQFSKKQHYQFFINIDNNVATGFQFNNEAWAKSGADYLLEDGILYKSTSNNQAWEWQEINSDGITYQQTDRLISTAFKKSLLQGLSPQMRLGFIIRDSQWQVNYFYPKSSRMALASIDTPPPYKDTTLPVLKLNGSALIRLPKGSDFSDPGATALDNIDGNISDRIKTESSVNLNEIGSYKITYRVSDRAGNKSELSRTLIITPQSNEKIVIDGNIKDWAQIKIAARNETATLKISETLGSLKLLIQSKMLGKNTQVFLDTDNDAATGLQFFGGDWGNAGVDYMVENNDLFKSKNPLAWSWDFNVTPIEYIRTNDVIELSIPKEGLNTKGNIINIGFINRDLHWSIINNTLPKNGLFSYTLGQTAQIPATVRRTLCNDPTRSQLFKPFEGGSFESNGFTYKQRRYFSEKNNEGFVLKVEDENNKMTEIGQYTHPPRLSSTNGAIYFRVVNTPLHRSVLWRINQENTAAIEVVQKGKSSPMTRFAFVGQVDYYTTRFSHGAHPVSLYKKTEDSEDQLLHKDSSSATEHLQVTYNDGKLFYALTTNQRIIGVIDDATGLKPLSSCR